jgi:hypothetical protein
MTYWLRSWVGPTEVRWLHLLHTVDLAAHTECVAQQEERTEWAARHSLALVCWRKTGDSQTSGVRAALLLGPALDMVMYVSVCCTWFGHKAFMLKMKQ